MSSDSASSRKARLAAVLMILLLVVVAAVIVYESSLLSWPLEAGSLAGLYGKPSPHIVNPPNGTLVVQVFSTPGQNPSSGSPVADSFVQIFSGSSVIPPAVFTATTNSSGLVQHNVVPAEYTIRVTSTLTNSTPSVTVLAYSNSTTTLAVDLNTTSYAASFFDIVSANPSGDVPTWTPIYVEIPATSPLPIATQPTYLSYTTSCLIGLPGGTCVSILNGPAPLIGVTVADQIESASAGTLLLEVTLNTPTNLSGVQQVTISTIGSSYMVSIINDTSGLPIPVPNV